MQRFNEKRPDRYAIVDKVTVGTWYITLHLRIPRKTTAATTKLVAYEKEHGVLLALRPGWCRLPVCEVHARDLGGGVHYCQDHWNAWEQVA